MSLSVGGGGCRGRVAVCRWDHLCMSYLIVISANRNTEAHQRAMPGPQQLGEAHVDD